VPGRDGRLRVLLADDQVVALRGAMFYVEALGMVVCATIDDPRRLSSAFEETHPDVVVIEPSMGQRGVAFAEIEALVTAHPDAPVLVLTSDLSPVVVETALEFGCMGIVPKTCSVDALGKALRAVATGERHLHPRALAALLQRRQAIESARAHTALSARELTVLSLAADGMTNAQIGAELTIAPDTVKTHIARVLDKLAARDRTQAVAKALRLGLFP
jgi:DNA-binding NarL/FixJ family response regulator